MNKLIAVKIIITTFTQYTWSRLPSNPLLFSAFLLLLFGEFDLSLRDENSLVGPYFSISDPTDLAEFRFTSKSLSGDKSPKSYLLVFYSSGSISRFKSISYKPEESSPSLSFEDLLNLSINTPLSSFSRLSQLWWPPSN